MMIKPMLINCVKSYLVWFILFISLIGTQTVCSQTSIKDSLLALIKFDDSDTLKVRHLTQLCIEYKSIRQEDTAFYYGNEALQLAEFLIRDAIRPDIRNSLKNNMAINHAEIGHMYSNMSDYTNASGHYNKALEINKETGNRQNIAVNLNDIGNIYYYQGDFVKTLQCFFQAYKINTELHNRRLAGVNLNNIGNVYYAHGDYTKAREYFSKGFEIFIEVGYKTGIAAALSNLGDVCLMQKKLKQALEYYNQSLKIYEELDDKYGIALCQTEIADIYSENGDYHNALEHYSNALEINKSWGHQNGVALNLGDIANLFIKQKKYNEAEEYLLNGLSLATEIDELPVIRDFNKSLSKVYELTGKYNLAYLYYVQYTASKDSLFNNDKSKEIGRLEMQHEIEMAEMERERIKNEELKIKTQKRERRNLLQYSGMAIGLLIIALLITFLGFIKVKSWMAEGITFFVFLLFFEFLLVLFDPYMDKFTKGEPAYKLLINALVAACIFPLHAFFEKILKRKLMKRK